jgi:hypothetical protein
MGCVQSTPAEAGPSCAQSHGREQQKQRDVQHASIERCDHQASAQPSSVGPAERHGASTSTPGQRSSTGELMLHNCASSEGLPTGDQGQPGPGSCLKTSLSVPGPSDSACTCGDRVCSSRDGGFADHGLTVASAISNVSTCSCGVDTRRGSHLDCPELPAAVASLPLSQLVARLEAATIRAYTVEHARGDARYVLCYLLDLLEACPALGCAHNSHCVCYCSSSRLQDYYSTCDLDLSPEHRALSCHLVRKDMQSRRLQHHDMRVQFLLPALYAAYTSVTTCAVVLPCR